MASVYLLFALLAGGLFFSGCGKGRKAGISRSGEGSGSNGKVLNYTVANDLANMDPSLITDIESALVATQVYEGLVRFKKDSVEIEPALAERWELSANGLQWTFHLQPGIKFTDGTPCDADAVVFSVMRQMDENHPFHVPGKMRSSKMMFGDLSTTESQLVTDVSATDAQTVVFTLARPYTPFLKNIAMTPASIVSPAAVKALKKDFNTTMTGTGPFAIKTYKRDHYVTLVRNPDYRGPRPALDEIRFQIIQDPNVRMNSLRKGDSDIITGIEPAGVDLLKNEEGIKLMSEPSMNLGYISLNNQRAPFDNAKVRLALCHAIDRDYIVNTLFSKTSEKATGIIPPGMLGYDAKRAGFAYDVNKTKALLAEAGYPNGFTVTLSTHGSPRIYNPVGVKLAERIQQDLAKVGVTAKLDQMEFPTFLAKEKSRDFQMSISGWISDNGDPDNFIYELAGREDNSCAYSNPDATRLMRQAATEADEGKRGELYKKADAMLAENPPFIVLNHAKQMLGVRNRVKGFSLHPTGVAQLAPVDLTSQ